MEAKHQISISDQFYDKNNILNYKDDKLLFL
jgi:hypothetical protein